MEPHIYFALTSAPPGAAGRDGGLAYSRSRRRHDGEKRGRRLPEVSHILVTVPHTGTGTARTLE